MDKIQKIIAASGLCSRRAAEELIKEGKVKVNGRDIKLGDRAGVDDIVTVNGKRLAQSKKQYIMLYKPRGFVTTLNDDRGRKDVSMLVDVGERLFPVGRLDLVSEGLLIMTNDGELAQKMTHPSNDVKKVYNVKVKGDFANISKLNQPMEIDGYTISKPSTRIVWQGRENQDADEGVLEITIGEGRNRQIRKMCEQSGFGVLWLKRVAIGKITLDPELRPGKYRNLTRDELDYLRSL